MELTQQTLKRAAADPAAKTLVTFLQAHGAGLGLKDATITYRFPIYREDDRVVTADVLVMSPNHGVLAFGVTSTSKGNILEVLKKTDDRLDQVVSHLFSRTVRYKSLRQSRKELAFPLEAAIYAPFLEEAQVARVDDDLSVPLLRSESQVRQFFARHTLDEPIAQEILDELSSVVEGSKALPRPKERNLDQRLQDSKAAQVAQLEAEINRFDRDQKAGYQGVLTGFQRIRGLAGSGKTVVLAMKAAITHIVEPEARIAFTFHTKSLYQHVRRLITRFYRQFDDRDPNWDKLTILHAWGGRSIPGIYSTACAAHGIRPLTYDQAQMLSSKPAFEFVCEDLLSKVKVQPIFDFVFVDEGQDFPASFLRLALALGKEQRMVLAYDELQTIFQPEAPSISDTFGVDDSGEPVVRLEEDIVLHKCYRNPLEVLVCAHAMGFGIYGKKIVQMLENRDHWTDLGYRVENEELRAGDLTRIRRLKENSPSSISRFNTPEEIIRCDTYANFSDEVAAVVEGIRHNIQQDGLEPDDILVISADDRHARQYLEDIAKRLSRAKINVNNVHEDSYSIRDFSESGAVTLSTIHKAKGNEAYMVYVVGIDALFGTSVRARNMIFTAMTRSKAWLRLSGIGAQASEFAAELSKAKSELPFLKFVYPSESDIRTMKRDLQESPEQKVDRALEEIEAELPVEEMVQVLEQKLRALRGLRGKKSTKLKPTKK